MDEYDRDAVYAEIERLGRAMHQLRPLYYDRLAQPVPGAERLITTGEAGLSVSDDDLRSAKIELAERYHTGFGVVEDMARQAHLKSGLGYSEGEQAKVIAEVALTLGRGQREVSDQQVLELSRYGGTDAALVALSAEDGDDDGEAVALASQTQESKARRTRAADSDTAEEILRRHPEFAHLFKPGKPAGKKHPAKSGREVTTRTRAHSPDEEDASTESPDAAIARYTAMREREWGGESRKSGTHGSTSYPPKSPQQREAEERRARDSHGLSIPAMHPSARER